MPSISQNQGQPSQSSFCKNLSSLLLQVPILIILVKNLVDTHFLGVLLLSLCAQWPEYKALECEDLFNKLKIEPGGYGISWNEDLDCSEGELYQKGVDVSLKLEDFRAFAENSLISANEASSILKCTKQNIDDLVKRGKLHPINKDGRYNLFLKCEVESRTWTKNHLNTASACKTREEDNIIMAAEPESKYGSH